MATNLKQFGRSLVYPSLYSLPRWLFSSQIRDYSRSVAFPNYFQNPVFRKDEQAKLIENSEISKFAALPVKPPGVSETSSVYFDPLVRVPYLQRKKGTLIGSLFVRLSVKNCNPKRTVLKYGKKVDVTFKVINHVMEDGKKQLARALVEKAFESIKRVQIERYHLATTPEAKAKIELDPKTILYNAVENCKPLLQLSPIKRGGITYQVPGPITPRRSLFLAIKWLLDATNDKERTIHFPEQFAWELLDAANNTGKVVKRKQDLHRQCEANRAYAHYRWQN